MTLAEILKNARIEKKLSYRQAAKRLGAWPSSIYAWERGDYKPGRKYISRIAEVYGVDISDLI